MSSRLTGSDIVRARLYNQRLAGPQFERPEEVVQWLGAVQSQEYANTKWGIAQRAGSLTDAAIDQAFADGKILRTHVMRPTWHFVVPEDIRWMLALTAPRVHALSAYYHRQQELDAAIFAKSHGLLTKALQGQTQLTRQEISNVLRDGSIPTTGFRLGFILMHAELEALICSGALRGKQHTYALLSERAPQAKTLTRDEALAELVRRYFTSHGPATLKDFAWWSGLTIADANAGIASVKSQLAHEKIDGSEYWFAPSTPAPQEAAPICYLLSDYDEYTIAYTNRTAYLLDPQRTYRANIELNRPVTMNGYVVGTWKRTIKTKMVNVEIELFTPLQPAETRALQDVVERYARFMDLPVTPSYT